MVMLVDELIKLLLDYFILLLTVHWLIYNYYNYFKSDSWKWNSENYHRLSYNNNRCYTHSIISVASSEYNNSYCYTC